MTIKTFAEYQQKAVATALPSALDMNYLAPGLVAEAGEVAGKWAKVVRDDYGMLTPEKREEILKEIGDSLWFMALLAHFLNRNLEDIAQGNIDKLADRKERGVLGGSGDNR